MYKIWNLGFGSSPSTSSRQYDEWNETRRPVHYYHIQTGTTRRWRQGMTHRTSITHYDSSYSVLWRHLPEQSESRENNYKIGSSWFRGRRRSSAMSHVIVRIEHSNRTCSNRTFRLPFHHFYCLRHNSSYFHFLLTYTYLKMTHHVWLIQTRWIIVLEL